jgi:peptidoglycan/LPS O-acetylase OafA/YrhL
MDKSIHLQSLRGLAVALVVLFHLGFTQFQNGWVGVDIFFVVSGFLMWKLYRHPILNGKYLDFYIRRFRRLLPALCVLLIFSNFIFFFRLLPYERGLLIREVVAANLFASNINYWMGDQYFSNGSFRPLLNLWSIALEIQFYLLFPLIVRFVKFSRARFICILILSFFAFIFLFVVSPETNFFLLPGRLWEFLVGMLVAAVSQVRPMLRPNYIKISFACATFLTLTLGQAFSRNQTIFFQMGSVCLFALLIRASWNATEKNFMVTGLSKLGDVSYSVYLIHFPLLAFLTYQPFLGNQGEIRGYREVLLFFSLLGFLSWLLNNFVEDSFFFRKNFVAIWASSLSLSFLFFCLQPFTLSIGFNSKELAVSSALTDRGEFRCGLLLRLPLNNDPSKTCLLKNSSPGYQKVLLIGNSHADAMKEALVEALPNKSIYLLNENNPLSSWNLETYIRAINQLRPTSVVLHSSAGSTNFEALEDLLRFTKSLGIFFIVVDSIPTPGFDVPSKAFGLLRANKPITDFKDSSFTIESYIRENKVELESLSRMASKREILKIPVVDLFCNPYCQIVEAQTLKPLYFDGGHLTRTGASKLVSRIKLAVM